MQQLDLLPSTPEALAAALCPSDPAEVVAAAGWALDKAMVERADGSRHLRTCLDSHVNSRKLGCSQDCERAQVALVWTRTSQHRGAGRGQGERRTG